MLERAITIDALHRLRSTVRWQEFGQYNETGGGCALIAESVSVMAAGGLKEWMKGQSSELVSIDSGCYITGDQRHIAHVWNILPSGRILDVTADQFRDGADIRITDATDRRYDNTCGCGQDG